VPPKASPRVKRRKSARSKRARFWPTAVDLFCGCGAVTEALKAAHFRVVAAVDNDPDACESFRLNHPTVTLLEKDIRDIDAAQLKSKLRKRRLDLLVVCAPCQPFSSHNRANEKDSRQDLMIEALRFVDALRPRLIFFENVPGLSRPRFAKLLGELRSGLSARGYSMSLPVELDAADFGVPQRRRRCVMFAASTSKSIVIQKTTSGSSRLTVREAFEGLPRLAAGQRSSDLLHFARAHSELALKRLRNIPRNGGSRKALPKSLRLACHTDNNSFPDVYGRMAWNSVAPTLTTGCTDVTKGRFAHPSACRAITLREAARLQTFPDEYLFAGNAQAIARQIGNAVPVRFIAELAVRFKRSLRV
jgi:DNA (cytosine-5)-methyltransferase 1